MREISESMMDKINKMAFIHKGSTNQKEVIDEVIELAKLDIAKEVIPLLRKSEEMVNGLRDKIATLLEYKRVIEHEERGIPKFIYPTSSSDFDKLPKKTESKVLLSAMIGIFIFLIFFDLNTLPCFLEQIGIGGQPGSFTYYMPGLIVTALSLAKNLNDYVAKNSSELNTRKASATFMAAFFTFVITTITAPTISADIWSTTEYFSTSVAIVVNIMNVFSTIICIFSISSILMHLAVRYREIKRTGEVIINPAYRDLEVSLFLANREILNIRELLSEHESKIETLNSNAIDYLKRCSLTYQFQRLKMQEDERCRSDLIRRKNEISKQMQNWFEEQSLSIQEQIDKL